MVTSHDSVNNTLSKDNAQESLQALIELQSLIQWCNFKKEIREGDDKPTKVPYHPGNYRASSSKPATWSSHEAVVRACRIANLFSGIGFFFNGQVYSGIDIDDCVDENGNIADWAWEIIRLLDSYTEFSTNGRGVHIVVKGLLQIKTLDKDKVEYIKGWKNNPPIGKVPKGKLELYSERRFFVVTGKHVPGSPTTINERQDQLLSVLNKFFIEPKEEKQREFYKKSPKLPDNYQPAEIPQDDNELWQIMFREKDNGRTWERLYYGDAGDYMGDDGRIDESASDAAIAAKLVFYTQHDASRVERMMRQMGLVRDKWDSHPTYLRQLTIDNAMSLVSDNYDPLYYKRETDERKERIAREMDAMMHKENGRSDTHHTTQEYIPSCKKHTFAAKEVPVKDTHEYMDMQQLGDAQLFARCFEGQIAYDSFEKEWYLWQGHYWKRDMHDHIRVLVSGHLGSVYLHANASLNKERAQIDRELTLLSSADDQEQIDKHQKRIKDIDALMKAFAHRAKELRKRSYNTGVLYFAESLLAIPTQDDGTSQWDSLTGKIGVKNGVLDLHTGICRDGKPDDYIRTISPTEWRGLNAPCPLFLKFLDALFELREDKEEVIRFLIRLLGYALTGTCKEAIFAILYGPEGRNGKSTLFKIIVACIGKALAGSIAKELLIDTGKSQHANGPKPDVLDLQGKRIAIAAETQKGDKLNISAIKHYSGGDELGGRGVFGKHNIRFDQTHTLFLHTNFKPHADPSDMAFWARACLIEFSMRFVEKPDPDKANEKKYDTGLEKRIIEEELSGVLACLVRGAMDYDENGLEKPESVQLASEAYRVSEDTLQTFMNECCVKEEGLSIQSSTFIAAYREWSGDGFKLTSKELKKQMEKKGFVPRHTKLGNFYDGIDFVGEGQGQGEGKNDSVKGGEGTKNTLHPASEDDSQSSGEGSEGSLHKLPHEDLNKNTAAKLSNSAFTAFTTDCSNGHKAASEDASQCGEGKKSAFTTENLPSPEPAIPDDFTYGEPCQKCGCGIACDMGSYAVCVRCYPPKGYHAYSHLVDMIYPRAVRKAEFGKGIA